MHCLLVLRKKRLLFFYSFVLFQTERIFLERHPDFVSNWGLVEDEETETWLGKDRRPYQLAKLSNL